MKVIIEKMFFRMNSICYYLLIFVFVLNCENYGLSESLLLSECNFNDENEQNCMWSNFEKNSCKWKISEINTVDEALSSNRSYLILRSNRNESSINSAYESNRISDSSTAICFTLRFIMSSNCKDCKLSIFAVINQSKNQFLNEYNMKNSKHDWIVAQSYFSLNITDNFKIYLWGHINSSLQPFIAIDYISVRSGSCNRIDSFIELSGAKHNSTSNSSFVDPLKKQIGPRITFWILTAVSLLILSAGTFAFIGISKCKQQHKRRLARSKLSNINPLRELPNDDLGEDIIFQDEFNIMPRGGSFIGNIIRQFSSKSLKSNG